jgi:hypothetical protein
MSLEGRWEGAWACGGGIVSPVSFPRRFFGLHAWKEGVAVSKSQGNLG